MHQVGRVGQVTVVELQAHRTLVTVAVDVVDALGVEAGRTADDTVHLIALQTNKKRRNTRHKTHTYTQNMCRVNG